MKSISFFLLLPLLFSCFITTAFAQWDRQYPLEKLENVLDISLHTDNYGFAVGTNDLILRLDNTTNTWDLLSSWNKSWQLKAVDYLEGTNGTFVVAGGNGMIISNNAGDIWTEIAGAPTGINAIKIETTSARTPKTISMYYLVCPCF